MPRLRKPHDVYTEITALIVGEMAVQDVNYCDIAGCCGMTVQTLSRKVRDPRKFYLPELIGLFKVLGIAPDRFKSIIYY